MKELKKDRHMAVKVNGATGIRTRECSSQSAVPYRLAIALFFRGYNPLVVNVFCNFLIFE